MKSLRKICAVCAVSITAALLPQAVSAEYTDVYEYDSYYTAVNRLSDLGIVSGYDDGTFHGDASITRAEFAKLIVCAMDAESEARASGISSKFYDVPQGNWAVPYIAYVSSKGIVSGYPDGSFGPDNTITYAEALTILGRILGYTEETIGAYWPTNYIEAASSIGLTKDLIVQTYAPINRAVAAVIIDRALFSKMSKAVNVNAPMLFENYGYTALEDVVVLATGKDDKSLYSDEVKLNDNSVYTSKMRSSLSAGEVLKYAVINRDGEIVCVKRYNEDGESSEKTKYTVYEDCYIIASAKEDSTLGSMEIKTSKGTFTVSNTEILDKVGETGTLVIDKNNKVISASTVEVEPMLASHDYTSGESNVEGTTINYTNLVVYRDGKAASVADIKKNDVIYYNTQSNTIDVYSKKVTGIYYDASPSKAYVSEVTVGGKSYVIGSDSALSRLDASSGAFEIGDKVTLLLGKNDKVVYAVELSDFDFFEYGVVTGSGQKVAQTGMNEGSSETYVKLYMTDGEEYEYTADRDYKDYVGKLVRITYTDSKVTLNTVNTSTNSKAYGAVDKSKRTLGGKNVLKDVKIIQKLSKGDDTIRLEILNFDTLEEDTVPESKVIASVAANSFGDIGILYVEGIGSTYSYGVVKNVSTETMFDAESNKNVPYRYTYTIYGENGETKYTTETNYGVSAGNGVGYRTLSDNSLTELISLYKLKAANSIDAVEGSRIKINGTIYKMASNVRIIDVSETKYKIVSVDELASSKVSSIKLYSDTKDDVVRVITVTK